MQSTARSRSPSRSPSSPSRPSSPVFSANFALTPDCDLLIISQDGVRYGVHRRNLATHSGIFDVMEGLPQPEQSQAGLTLNAPAEANKSNISDLRASQSERLPSTTPAASSTTPVVGTSLTPNSIPSAKTDQNGLSEISLSQFSDVLEIALSSCYPKKVAKEPCLGLREKSIEFIVRLVVTADMYEMELLKALAVTELEYRFSLPITFDQCLQIYGLACTYNVQNLKELSSNMAIQTADLPPGSYLERVRSRGVEIIDGVDVDAVRRLLLYLEALCSFLHQSLLTSFVPSSTLHSCSAYNAWWTNLTSLAGLKARPATRLEALVAEPEVALRSKTCGKDGCDSAQRIEAARQNIRRAGLARPNLE